jgi:hypothetical protein
MDEKEDITTYLLRVDEVVNVIRRLGEEVNDSLVVQKVLMSLPLRYDAKVSAIEENRDLIKMTMDELHGTLTTYEMRIDTKMGSQIEKQLLKSRRKQRTQSIRKTRR